jgi:2-haloalkanoic acid dehalogenase type II
MGLTGLDPGDFDALTFDCYGTLIDWEAGALGVLRPWADGQGLDAGDDDLLARFAAAQVDQETLRPFRRYPDVVGEAFAEIAAGYGKTLAAQDRERLARSIGDWPPFADTVQALGDLKRRFTLGVLSNVDVSSFARTHARLGKVMEVIVTADDAGAYKPALAHFHRGIEAFAKLGIEKARILHVAQSRFHDIAPATSLDLTCVWVDRRAGRQGRGLNIPSDAETPYVVGDMAELAAHLGRDRGDN